MAWNTFDASCTFCDFGFQHGASTEIIFIGHALARFPCVKWEQGGNDVDASERVDLVVYEVLFKNLLSLFLLVIELARREVQPVMMTKWKTFIVRCR